MTSLSSILKSASRAPADTVAAEFTQATTKYRHGAFLGGTLAGISNRLGYTREYHAQKFLESNKSRLNDRNISTIITEHRTETRIKLIAALYLNPTAANIAAFAQAMTDNLATNSPELETLTNRLFEAGILGQVIAEMNRTSPGSAENLKTALQTAMDQILANATNESIDAFGRLLPHMSNTEKGTMADSLLAQPETPVSLAKLKLLFPLLEGAIAFDKIEARTTQITNNAKLQLLASAITPVQIAAAPARFVTLLNTSITALETTPNGADPALIKQAIDKLVKAVAKHGGTQPRLVELQPLLLTVISTENPECIEHCMKQLNSMLTGWSTVELKTLIDYAAATSDLPTLKAVASNLPFTDEGLTCLVDTMVAANQNSSERVEILQIIQRRSVLDKK
jgi:hypothetical protein